MANRHTQNSALEHIMVALALVLAGALILGGMPNPFRSSPASSSDARFPPQPPVGSIDTCGPVPVEQDRAAFSLRHAPR